MKDFTEKKRRIASRLVEVAKMVLSEEEPDLYILNDDCSLMPIYLPDEGDVTSSKKKKKHSFEGKEVFFTKQAADFYKEMGSKNKKKIQSCCKELQSRGTLEGNQFAEKVEGTADVFAIRLKNGITNDRFFYCYSMRNCVIVFEAYTKQTKKIPTDTLNDAKKKVKKYLELESTDEFISFNSLIQGDKDEQQTHH